MLPNITKPFKSDLSFLIDRMQQPNVAVVDIVHKTTSYSLFNYLNISIINEICKKFAYQFVQYFNIIRTGFQYRFTMSMPFFSASLQV